MNVNEVWTFEECAAATGYKPKSLRVYHARGDFVEVARTIGKAHLFTPADVLRWKRDRVKNRNPAGTKSPPDPKPARKRQ